MKRNLWRILKIPEFSQSNIMNLDDTMIKDHIKVRECLSGKVMINVAGLCKKRRHGSPCDLVFARNLPSAALVVILNVPSSVKVCLTDLCAHGRPSPRVANWRQREADRAMSWEMEREPQDRGSEIGENGEFGGHRDSFGLFSLFKRDRHEDSWCIHLGIVRSCIYYAEQVNKACGSLRVYLEKFRIRRMS